jgi:hypothetical protein
LYRYGTEWWNDPENDLCVCYGTQMAPFYANPDMRAELAAFVYSSLVPDAAQKHIKPPVDPAAAGGGMMSQMMMMMMMSKLRNALVVVLLSNR